MGAADADVAEPPGVAEGEFPEPVHAVDAPAPVVSLFRSGRAGFRCCSVGGGRCLAVQGAVGAFVVVDVLELVQPFVEVRHGMGTWLPCEPFLQGLMEALDFPLGLRVVRGAVFLGDAQGVELVFEGVAAAPAAGQAGGVDHAVVGQGRGREPVFGGAGQERGHDGGDGERFEGGAGEQVAGVVIEEVQDLGVGSVGQGPVGEVGLPAFVGLVGFEAVQGGFGRFFGSGLIMPAVCRMRRIVEGEGGCSPSRCRCQAMVTEPASRPAAVRLARRAWIRAVVAVPVARRVLFGRRERGSSDSLPPARCRLSSSWTSGG